MNGIEQLMRRAPVIPVLVIDSVADAVPLAEALVAGGLPVLEVTLRTPAALGAIAAMKQVPGAIVGAGTVLNPTQFEQAREAGAEFIVSPGLTDKLVRLAIGHGVPFLPGVASAGDVMRGLDFGLTHFKFFPAMAAGGIPALKALIAPFFEAKFCPTGGITLETAPNWLALPSVLCVGGSWVAPNGANPATIEALARQAAGLSGRDRLDSKFRDSDVSSGATGEVRAQKDTDLEDRAPATAAPPRPSPWTRLPAE